MIILNIEQRSEAWYEARCGRVTGTRFADLVAGESTKTYKDLVLDIACEIITHRQEDEGYISEAMENGIAIEPIARAEYEYLTGSKVIEAGFVIPDEAHKYHEWIGVSPDGLTPDGMIEIKCPLMKTHLGYIEGGKLPSQYRYQVQGQLYTTGLPYCDFISYVEGMKPFIVRVFPDTMLFAEFEMRLDKLIIDVNNKLNHYQNYDYTND